MFAIGDKVVHPVHGAGVIEDVETREVSGAPKDYYVLNIHSCNMRVMVPCSNAEDLGVRNIISISEYDNVLQALGGAGFEEDTSISKEKWNYRYRILMDKIKSGDVYELAEIIRALSIRNRLKPLSSGEKRLFDQAWDILVSELALVSGASIDAVSDTVEESLQLSAVCE